MCRAAERIAREFYETHERLAPSHSEIEWDEVPRPERVVMVATAQELLNRGEIATGENVW